MKQCEKVAFQEKIRFLAVSFFLLCFFLAPSPIAAAPHSSETDWRSAICQKKYPERLAARILVREFERRPSFEKFDQMLPGELQISENILSADLDCSGQEEALIFTPLGRKIYAIRLDRMTRSIRRRRIGELPKSIEWSHVRVGKMDETSCDSLFVPKQGEAMLFAASTCDADKLQWKTISTPVEFSEASILFPVSDFHGGNFVWFGIERSASHLLSAYGSLSGKPFQRVLSQNLDGWQWIGVRRNTLLRSEAVFVHPERTLLISKFPSAGTALASAPSTFTFFSPRMADLNGDERTEVVLPGAALHGSWIALPYGDGFLEIPNADLSLSLKRHPITAVGDYDGNGLDDLLVRKGEIFSFLLTRPGPPIAGAEISAFGSVFQTNSSGAVEIPLQSADSLIATLRSENNVVFSAELRRERKHALSRTSIFLVDNQRQNSDNAELRVNDNQPIAPSVCLGYTAHAETATWNRQSQCPDGYVFLEQDDGALPAGTCCRLPEAAILTADEIFVDEQCPPDSIATGVYWDPNRTPGECSGCRQRLRCRRMNTEKYTLGPRVRGVQYGDQSSVSALGEEMSRNDLPIALKWGVGRVNIAAFDSDGCIGNPPGSVLVGRRGRRCAEMEFAEILRKIPMEQSNRTLPVKMFPDCLRMADLYDPSQGCETEAR